MAIHLTPTELAREAGLDRREVIDKCMQMGVPIFEGRIDKPSSWAASSATGVPLARRTARAGVAPLKAQYTLSSNFKRRREMEAGTLTRDEPDNGLADDRRPASVGGREVRVEVALRQKRDGEWHDVTYAAVGEIVSEIARGLLDLGIEKGDRVGILANTRPEWTYVDFAISAAGGTVVPVYPTNSPKECEWVVGNSEARAIICEDASQVAKIVAVRDNLPNLETVIVIDPSGDVADAIALDDVRERGRAVEPARLEERTASVGPDDAFTFIYTSGTTGPPKGCVLSHGNYRGVLDMCESIGVLEGGSDTAYLFLPLAHAYALLIQLLSFDGGGTIAYFGGDTKAVVPELAEVKPTYLPSVPRIFEKIYTLATAKIRAQMSDEEFRGMVELGVKVHDADAHGRDVPADLRAKFEALDEQVFKNVRAIFGGNVRQAVTGAAPIAQEILDSSTPPGSRSSRATG